MTVEQLLPTWAFLSLFGVMALAGVIYALVLGGGASNGKNAGSRGSRWLRGLAMVLPVVILTALMGLGFVLESVERNERHDRRRAEAALTTTVSLTQAISDTDLEDAAAAPPRIELDDAEPSAEVATDEDFDLSIEPSESTPAWAEGPLDPNQKVFVSGPFTSKQACDEDTRLQISHWYSSQAPVEWPSRLGPRPPVAYGESMIEAEETVARTTSVGQVYLKYTLVKIEGHHLESVRESLLSTRREIESQGGVRLIATGGGAILAVLGLAHAVLRAPSSKEQGRG